jgi:L-lysine 2,3-aminomutase
MERKIVTFTVVTSIVVNGNRPYVKDIREVRRILKEQIGNIPDVKIIRIDSKES